jgi:hypothetical protein
MITYMGALVIGAFVVFATGRAAGLWYGLGIGGVCGLVLLWGRGPELWRQVREAEERRIIARDF